MVEGFRELCDLVVELCLDLFSLFLLEQNLILVVDLGLCESLVALVTDILQPLLEAHFFRVIELLQVSELLLRVKVNLVDLVLKLSLLLL